jgi:hypothetical protein
MFSSECLCYPLGPNAILWIGMLSSGLYVILWEGMLSSSVAEPHHFYAAPAKAAPAPGTPRYLYKFSTYSLLFLRGDSVFSCLFLDFFTV